MSACHRHAPLTASLPPTKKQTFHLTRERNDCFIGAIESLCAHLIMCSRSTPSPFVFVPKMDDSPVPDGQNKLNKAGPLAGLGLAVKDLFHMQGIPTSAGNPDWLKTHSTPTTTNSTVSTLINAGAVFKGKTITDELAYSLHGQNKHYPALVNPAAPAHIPGGSSSGSAVAVSTHLADIGLGTDTGGSIRVPASYQGLWGLRTTHGAVPCDNMVCLAPSFDTIGWMTRDINTLALVSNVCIQDTHQFTLPDTPRIGVAKHLVCDTAHSALSMDWIASRKDTHTFSFISNDQLNLAALDTANTFRVLQGAEIWQQHGDWITQTAPDIATDIALRLQWCKQLTSQQVHHAKQQQILIKQHINKLFETLDVLIIPTTPGVAPRCNADEKTLADDRNALLEITSIAGLAGLPQLHMPLFSLRNAPCGLSLVGKKGSDLALIKLAKNLIS